MTEPAVCSEAPKFDSASTDTFSYAELLMCSEAPAVDAEYVKCSEAPTVGSAC